MPVTKVDLTAGALPKPEYAQVADQPVSSNALDNSRQELLTTQEAASLLNVSHPFLLGLLEQAELECTQTGNQWRLRITDVLAYRERQQARSAAALRELAQLDQELGFYA